MSEREFRVERRLGFFFGLRLGASRLLNGCYLNSWGFRKTPTGFEKLSKDDKDRVRQRLQMDTACPRLLYFKFRIEDICCWSIGPRTESLVYKG